MRFAYPGYGLRATWLSGQFGGRGGEQIPRGFLRWDRAFQLQSRSRVARIRPQAASGGIPLRARWLAGAGSRMRFAYPGYVVIWPVRWTRRRTGRARFPAAESRLPVA